MRHDPETARQPFEAKRHRSATYDASIVGERVCAFLRKLHPARTADNVAADLHAWRIKAATVAKMLERETTPGTLMWCALIDAYGPNFLAAALPKQLAWLDEAAQAQERAAIRAQIEALETRLERL